MARWIGVALLILILWTAASLFLPYSGYNNPVAGFPFGQPGRHSIVWPGGLDTTSIGVRGAVGVISLIGAFTLAALLSLMLIFSRRSPQARTEPAPQQEETELLHKIWGQMDSLEERVANLETILMNRIR